jgi:RIO-like serine/threonine protein kinase
MIGDFSGLRIIGRIGRGRRCVVWRARHDGRDVVLKRFADTAIAKHAARHAVPLARFEFERNQALRAIAALRHHISRPLGFVADAARHMLIQEFIDGTPLHRFAATASAEERSRIGRELERIVNAAHDAGIYDLDLHPLNVLIRRDADHTPRAMLFDFNKIPYHEWPPNPLARWLLGRGWIGPESRDRRGLRAVWRVLGYSRR